MAITETGTPVIGSAASGGSATFDIAVTVPADANICICCTIGYQNNADDDLILDALNWINHANRDDFEVLDNANWNTAGNCLEVYYMLSSDANWPGSGSQTLSGGYADQLFYDSAVAIMFFKGIDMTTPFSGVVDKKEETSPLDNWTSSLSSVDAGDWALLFSESYGEDCVVDGSGETEIINGLGGGDGYYIAAAYEDGETAMTVSSAAYLVALAVVLQAAAAAAAGHDYLAAIIRQRSFDQLRRI